MTEASTAVKRDENGVRDFMCICTDEARAQAEACYQRVLERAGCEESELISAVVYGLQWNLKTMTAEVDGVPCDMWAAVSVKCHGDYDENSEEGEDRYRYRYSIWVECDRIEHGFARAFELAEEEDERRQKERGHDDVSSPS